MCTPGFVEVLEDFDQRIRNCMFLHRYQTVADDILRVWIKIDPRMFRILTAAAYNSQQMVTRTLSLVGHRLDIFVIMVPDGL